MDQVEIDIDKTLLPWLSRSVKIANHEIADRLHEAGLELTKVQWLMLRRLNGMDGLPQHNLAFLTDRNTASLARLITTMEKKNLVARIPSKTDQRINLIHITSKGEKILKLATPVVKNFLDKMQEGISTDEIMEVIRILKKTHENLNVEPFEGMKTK